MICRRLSVWPLALLHLFIIIAALLATCRSGYSATFTFALPSTFQHGTELNGAVISDPAKDTGAALDTAQVAFAKTAETVTPSLTASTWKSSMGGIIAQCRSAKIITGYSFTFTITNGWTHRLDRIDFRLPEIYSTADPANKIENPFRGGSVAPWAMDWAQGQGNTGNWPGTAYSPLVTLWNDRTKDTCAITFANRSLTRTCLYWFSGGGNCFNPFLRLFPNLGPGESLTLSVEYRLMTGGPLAHQKFYRQYWLAPFMKDLGIPEAMGPLGDGPVAMTATGADQFAASANAAQAAGASAYIQWAAPDGLAGYYNPYPPDFAWFNSLAPGRIPTGCLINPFIGPRIPTDGVAFPDPGHKFVNLHLNLAAPDTRLYLARLRDALAAKGVTLAFWDTGGEPDGCSGHEWLKVLWSWKQAGISIMPESSCDVAAWTTGLWMEYPYSWSEYSLPRVVTPQADLCAHTNFPDARNSIDWTADAKAKGVRPVIDVAQLGGGK